MDNNKSGILILLGVFAIIFNTVISFAFKGYELESALMGDLALFTSTSLLYLLGRSEKLSGGFKVALFCIFGLTAIIKFVCCLFYQNTTSLIIALGILMAEIAAYALCMTLSK